MIPEGNPKTLVAPSRLSIHFCWRQCCPPMLPQSGPNVAPMLPQCGPTLPHCCPNVAPMGPQCCPNVAPMWPQCCPNVVQCCPNRAPTLPQCCPNVAPMWPMLPQCCPIGPRQSHCIDGFVFLLGLFASSSCASLRKGQ